VRAAFVVGVLVVHNLVTNLWFGGRWYVRVNLATAALVAWVGGVGLSWGEATVWPALVVLGAVAVAVAVPRTRRLFADQRMAGVDGWGTAWRALVRIPLGTVGLEEVAFPGVLPALLSPAAAAGLFGLWHITPTVRGMQLNGLAPSVPAVAAAVGVTAVVGLALNAVAGASGGLLAPALVHAAANSGSTVAAYGVLRRG
jgi:uncharacterized protein